jgi:hypothetical protein
VACAPPALARGRAPNNAFFVFAVERMSPEEMLAILGLIGSAVAAAPR